MINITPQERRILTFLVAALLVGSAVKLIRFHLLPQGPPDVSLISQSPSESAHSDSTAVDTPDAQAQNSDGKVNINTAAPEQLQKLSGVGPQLARRIVEYRRQHGPFASPRDITAVRGIGEKTYQRLRDAIMVDSSRPADTLQTEPIQGDTTYQKPDEKNVNPQR
jgi:comEA protein